jgi:hypothetical protein
VREVGGSNPLTPILFLFSASTPHEGLGSLCVKWLARAGCELVGWMCHMLSLRLSLTPSNPSPSCSTHPRFYHLVLYLFLKWSMNNYLYLFVGAGLVAARLIFCARMQLSSAKKMNYSTIFLMSGKW